uniref:Uncharacterized protein n=1 Tax=Rhizophora mucronata TaxID=61149 RepID=A0A2P2PZK4_RHIMU
MMFFMTHNLARGFGMEGILIYDKPGDSKSLI